MFIDESGESSLNFVSNYFVLASVIIDIKDFQTTEGYLRLLKRKFLCDEAKIIHSTDLFERPYHKYRRLIKPRDMFNRFIHELRSALKILPFKTGIYYVNKNEIMNKYGYTPAPKRRRPFFVTSSGKKIKPDWPYQLCSLEAIQDFTLFLVSQKATGEIVIESRMGQDSDFVSYFDEARKPKLPGGIINPLSNETKNRISSLSISNKKQISGGLEIADIASYCSYRKLVGDPDNRVKGGKSLLVGMHSAIKQNTYVTGKSGRKMKKMNE